MKVALINAEWLPVPPVLGGPVEETLYETAISIRNPELTVISPWADALRKTPIQPSGIFYHVDIPAQKKSVMDLMGDRAPPAMQNPGTAEYFCYLNGATDLLHEMDPDVIQVHNRAEFVPYFLKQFPHKRLILYMHNEARYSNGYLKEAVQRLDHLIFVSRYLARRFLDHFPEAENKSTVVYNSVNTTVWHPKLKAHPQTDAIRKTFGLCPGRTVLFMGRTVPAKGLSFLLEAMDRVRQKLPGVKLLVAGSPFFKAATTNPFLKALKKRASKMKDTVVFTGYIDHHKTPYIYAAADVTVVPSIWGEPFGKVVVESMATGVPVIGSRRGAIPEIVEDGVNGILINNPKNTGRLADQILELLNDATCREKMGVLARQRVETTFSKPIRMARMRTFYESQFACSSNSYAGPGEPEKAPVNEKEAG